MLRGYRFRGLSGYGHVVHNQVDRKQRAINGRILVIDDNPAIHDDFAKILAREAVDTGMSQIEKILFGDSGPEPTPPSFELQFAQQGAQGVAMARQALAEGRPFALAFIDMRMPPGWDGLETIEHLWKADPDVQVVICSAHSDYDWADFFERLGHSDKLLVLKKPFEPIEVLQCASALTRKWHDQQVVRRQVHSLEHMVSVRTMGLEAANNQLRHIATHDALTGLPNRVLLDDRLDQAIMHAERNRAAIRRAGARPGSLQVHQRLAGPSRRRRTVESHRAATARRGQRGRHRRARGRR